MARDRAATAAMVQDQRYQAEELIFTNRNEHPLSRDGVAFRLALCAPEGLSRIALLSRNVGSPAIRFAMLAR